MELVETVRGHVATFAAKVGIDDLALEDGLCSLAFGEPGEELTITVEVLPEESRVLFHATVAELGPEPEAADLARLLELNLYALGTSGGALGVDPASGAAILTFAWIFDDLDYGRFERLLEETYAAASHVRSCLAPADSTAEAPETRAAAPSREKAASGGFMIIDG
jgi:hypothetical protein